ncbi:hypothetical protein, conserved [Trypanosoma brucei gambiense DAL972]|uniref:ER membrane protein complex subunit 2 n=2 Tax=Trypanosoma brucei TaxID=5691 RepID=C9ZTV4_TRYB9|nr:hypothetical protein, conserved [Trypanosoma brucei gambiense DAL972]RHW71372.1 TPR repeat [Trypanosoma brucei equiperdum]CBH12840.1 hypothetical protein, conserved [Trypanosoma brucei gambiense DAL972]|eukprot:XP_011775119.1 hypothetical protein, conserved [Trypanosoma brucei gambiense DAL972]
MKGPTDNVAESNISLQSLTPLGVKQLSRKEKRELLQLHREKETRNSNVVLLLGTDLLAGGTSGIGSQELFCIYEQILIAALDCGRVDTSRQYLSLLQKQFGKQSVRVRRLEGLCLEAEGRAEEAEGHYRALLKDFPSDDFPVKRLSTMLKSEGKYHKAIEVLEKQLVYTDVNDEKHTFLELHGGNCLSVYRELSNLHYLCENYTKALHHANEAMLLSSSCYLSHTRLAELYYMAGDHRHSLVEYAQSLRLNDHPNNSRAAYGLWVVANEIIRQSKSSTASRVGDEQKEEAVSLRAWAEKKLVDMYKGSPMLSALEAMLHRDD